MLSLFIVISYNKYIVIIVLPFPQIRLPHYTDTKSQVRADRIPFWPQIRRKTLFDLRVRPSDFLYLVKKN